MKKNSLISKIKLAIAAKDTKSNSSISSVIPEATTIIAESKEEQQARWFAEKNNLIEAMDDDPPIVYQANFESDTIRKQDQYGYKGKDAPKREDEGWDGEQLPDKVLKLVIPKSTTAKFLTEQEEFDERFSRMEEQVKEEAEQRKRDREERKDIEYTDEELEYIEYQKEKQEGKFTTK